MGEEESVPRCGVRKAECGKGGGPAGSGLGWWLEGAWEALRGVEKKGEGATPPAARPPRKKDEAS